MVGRGEYDLMGSSCLQQGKDLVHLVRETDVIFSDGVALGHTICLLRDTNALVVCPRRLEQGYGNIPARYPVWPPIPKLVTLQQP